MRRAMKRLALIIASAALLIPGFALPASAGVPHEVFDTYPKAFNNWFGYDGYVNAYNMGVTNDYFTIQYLYRCISEADYAVDYVVNLETQECPFNNTAFDNFFAGSPIFQIKDDNSGLCVGDDLGGFDTAYETKCNSTSYPATGGGPGTVFVLYPQQCPSGYALYISRQWTDANLQTSGIVMTDVNGANISIGVKGEGTCLRAA